MDPTYNEDLGYLDDEDFEDFPSDAPGSDESDNVSSFYHMFIVQSPPNHQPLLMPVHLIT